MHRIYDVPSIRANAPEPAQQPQRDGGETQGEAQAPDLPELPDPAEVGESG